MSVENDARGIFLYDRCATTPIAAEPIAAKPISAKKAEDCLKSLSALVICKHSRKDGGAITATEKLRELHFRMFLIIASSESSYKSNDNHLLTFGAAHGRGVPDRRRDALCYRQPKWRQCLRCLFGVRACGIPLRHLAEGETGKRGKHQR